MRRRALLGGKAAALLAAVAAAALAVAAAQPGAGADADAQREVFGERAAAPGAPVDGFGAAVDIGGGGGEADAVSAEDMALRFLPAFVASISMIIVSELGDKTFFIAAIMAMKHSRSTVFAGACLALAVMTVLSSVMGYALPAILPREYTHLASTALFLYFGVTLLRDAYLMAEDAPNEELEEVESELDKKELEDSEEPDLEDSTRHHRPGHDSFFSPVFVQCFTMTFLAEWGDRSQIATIALAAAKDPIGVTLGGIIGHACCTGLAVVGGKLVATRISEKTVAAVGGVLFLLFAVHAVLSGE